MPPIASTRRQIRLTTPRRRKSLSLPAESMLLNPKMYLIRQSSKDSQKPRVSIATPIELAKVNIKPIAPPNSGP
jgi:hypothetical protein